MTEAQRLDEFEGLVPITGTTPLDIRRAHIMATLPVLDSSHGDLDGDKNDDCQPDSGEEDSGLKFPPGVGSLYDDDTRRNTYDIDTDGFIDKNQVGTGFTGKPIFPGSNIAAKNVDMNGTSVNLCVMHQTVTPTGIAHHVWMQNNITESTGLLPNGTYMFVTISEVEKP